MTSSLGKIIFANLLQLPLNKYFSFVKQVEDNPLLKKWLYSGLVQKENLSRVDCLLCSEKKKHTILGKYIKHERGEYKMQYSHPYFQFYYRFDEILWESFVDESNEKRLLHFIRRINSRNIITYGLFESIAKEQKDYLSTEDTLNLRYLTQIELVQKIEQIITDISQQKVCNTWISRLISNIFIGLSSGMVVPVKKLLPSSRDKLKWRLQKILKEENFYLIDGKISAPYSDSRLQEILFRKFNILTTRRNVTSIRIELSISSTRTRSRDLWCFLTPDFHYYIFLKRKEIIDKVPQSGGIYEISLRQEQINYQDGISSIFYIGSSKNLKKRLMEHLIGKTKNKVLNSYVQNSLCKFRFLRTESDFRKEEKRLYDFFVTTFGEAPSGNQISPPHFL